MDRFKLDDVEDRYDAVEPMRPSSFDMSFTLSSGRRSGMYASSASDCEDVLDDKNNTYDYDNSTGMPAQRRKNSNKNLLKDHGRLHADELLRQDSKPTYDGVPNELVSSMKSTTSASTSRKESAALIAQKLEEKAHETIATANLCGQMPWKLVKRMQDVHIYRPGSGHSDLEDKVCFRVSCEIKAKLSTIMEYLTPSHTRNYADIENQVFPGLLHAAVVKRMELPERVMPIKEEDLNASHGASSSIYDEDLAENFPRLQVKWHASRFAGRFVKPVDFFFVEYANVETMADGRTRGFGYVRSVESFKGDELATRLNREDVTIPQSVSKCKRALISKGIYLVSPTADSPGTYEVTFMLVLDFQQQFQSAVASKIIHNFTERLIGIRELLFNTLFQPVTLLSKGEWKPAKSNKCALCTSYFTIMKKQHHCRACGEAVCGQCSRMWVVRPGANKESQTRLCTSCSLQARNYLVTEQPARSPLPNFAASLGPRALGGNVMMDSIGRSARMFSLEIQVASATSNLPDTFNAVSVAFASLMTSLGDQAPHFMMVSYSAAHEGRQVYEALADCAPDTLFMGGTSSAGVFSEAGCLDSGPAIGLWGIFDPEGSYAVLNADLNVEDPRSAGRRCTIQGMELLQLEQEDTPDFIWMNLCCGSEEVVVKAVNEVVDCSMSVVGGSSSKVPDSSSRYPASQLCSEGGEVGYVTTNGVCFAICSPSVEVSKAMFSCYTAKSTAFVVTQAEGRELQMLDNKPAFMALNDACHGMLNEFVNHPQRYNIEHNTLPMYYTMARTRKELRSAKTSRHQIIQPVRASRDMTLYLGAEVFNGERLRMMSVSTDVVEEKISIALREALHATAPVIDRQDVVGCLMTASINYSKIMHGELKTVMKKTCESFGSKCALLGSVSDGQQGSMTGAREAVHANAMFSTLIITNRKKGIKLNPLRRVNLRRLSR